MYEKSLRQSRYYSAKTVRCLATKAVVGRALVTIRNAGLLDLHRFLAAVAANLLLEMASKSERASERGLASLLASRSRPHTSWRSFLLCAQRN